MAFDIGMDGFKALAAELNVIIADSGGGNTLFDLVMFHLYRCTYVCCTRESRIMCSCWC